MESAKLASTMRGRLNVADVIGCGFSAENSGMSPGYGSSTGPTFGETTSPLNPPAVGTVFALSRPICSAARAIVGSTIARRYRSAASVFVWAWSMSHSRAPADR